MLKPVDPDVLSQSRTQSVTASLREDLGDGDITARLIPEDRLARGRVITRETAVLAGRDWVDEVFRQVDPTVTIEWLAADGDTVLADQALFRCSGPARSILTAERCALNWLQTLSGVATRCQQWSERIAHTGARLLDTRKTIPGLRLAQKYAVTCGGGLNHRLGLYDAFLIKENHILACGSITAAIERAHEIAPGRPVEVETETPGEFREALQAGADIIMLDEFSLDDMRMAVAENRHHQGRVVLEASGGINTDTLVPIAETGVDYLSLGALTKDLQAVDLSLRLE